LTSCNPTSAFRGKGKNLVWQAWQAYEEITGTFRLLATHSFKHLDFNLKHFQQLIAVLCNETCPLTSVNSIREFFVVKKENRHHITNTRCEHFSSMHVRSAV